MSCDFGSLKKDEGIKGLNEHLATRSYIGGPTISKEDFDKLAQLSSVVDENAYPHVHRWARHLNALKIQFPLRNNWSGNRRGGSGVGGGDRGGGAKGKSSEGPNMEGLLPGAEMGKVCTRFPPEPSGYMHIGHAKAAMLNHYYAREFKGKMILRFDDTNPSKEKMEFEESMVKDLATLEIIPDVISHTSDHFDKLQQMMEAVIKKGKAYVDDTDVETMRSERDAGVESKRRGNSVEENLRLFKEMLKGSEEGLNCCVRGKIDMQDKNKCMRDPVFYRCKIDTPHHKHGTKYKAYPTYDFACPVVDAIEGVTHALRTIEYKDREAMYHWVLDAAEMRKVHVVEFSKTQFSHTILSKRKLTLFVDKGWVEDWNDPRFPTVQGILRRGMTVDGLKEFVVTQGMSKATNMMEWDKIWAINKQKIDPVVPRYASVTKEDAVVLKLDGPKEPFGKLDNKHPKNEEIGKRLIMMSNQVYIEQEDAAAIEPGEQVTLLHWGNVYVDKLERDPKTNKVVSATGRLNIEGNVKDTKKKIHWLAKLDNQLSEVVLREYDHLVTKAKIEDDDDLESIINPQSQIDTMAIGDPLLKTLPKGTRIQLERRGFYIVDSVAFPAGSQIVLIKIPDGKAKDMSVKSAIDPSKLQAGQKAKSSQEAAKEDKKAAKGGKAEPKAEPKAEAKAGAKEKKKAEPKAAGKPGDRPIDDVSRLNIRVGKIVKVWEHPESEKLWCEEIDLGEGQNRTIASGLRHFVKKEGMQDKMVCVLANLKPRKLVGFESQGMVMCATSKDGSVVELMQPPSGAKIGERVMIEGVDMLEPDDKLNEKTGKAPWPALQDGFRTTAGKLGAFKGAVWQTSAGPVTCASVADGQIS